MSVKPCPACDEPWGGDWKHGDGGPQLLCGNCGLCGPAGELMDDAEREWNALPRRGDGLAWRSEPPDKPGRWLVCRLFKGEPVRMDVHRYSEGKINELAAHYTLDPDYQFSGPIHDPQERDSEKEATK